MAVKPVSPKDAIPQALALIPDTVIEAFNTLIVQNLNQGQSVVMQKDIADLIAKNMMISKDQVFVRGYLNVEPLFRQAGWVVIYDKPAYNETYEPHFTFRYIEAK